MIESSETGAVQAPQSLVRRVCAPGSGKLVAVVGAGPAGVACAHQLAMLGNEVVLYEARPQGSPACMLEDEEARAALGRCIARGRVRIEHGRKLGLDLDLSELHLCHDAVFLGVGLAGGRVLGLCGDDAPGLVDAGKHVAAVHRLEDLLALPVPHRAIVIGAALSAVDMAVRLKRLGAHDVTLAVRHGLEADGYELSTARASFVRVRQWVAPLEVLHDARGGVESVRFEQTRWLDGRVANTGGFTDIATHAVFKAVGRAANTACEGDESVSAMSRDGDRIRVDACFRTAQPGIYAGGDCVAPGLEAGQATRHGRLAALAIHADLQS